MRIILYIAVLLTPSASAASATLYVSFLGLISPSIANYVLLSYWYVVDVVLRFPFAFGNIKTKGGVVCG